MEYIGTMASERQQVKVRLNRDEYRGLRIYAATHDKTIQSLVEDALNLFMQTHGISVSPQVSRGESSVEPGKQAHTSTRGVAGRTRRA